MQIRTASISASIAGAISGDHESWKKKNRFPDDFFQALLAFFSLYKLTMTRYRVVDFLNLRHNVWHLDEEEYTTSFQFRRRVSTSTPAKNREAELIATGDLGYSGSTFFSTPDSKFLIKSLPRRFEHEFFTHDLFDDYVGHMKSNPKSLLVRITDMVYTPQATLGGILGLAPTHHIVMENLLYGKGDCGTDASFGHRWETYDLKPQSYFFPERDIADGRLVPESVLDRLFDNFPGHVRVKAESRRELLSILDADTKLLAKANAVDYSLFLIRIPGPAANAKPIPSLKSQSHPWRTGVQSVDGQWIYRAVILDFFWAKHKFHARAMTALVKAYNLLANKGPMSITAQPDEYRDRFMSMVKGLFASSDGDP